MYDFSDRSMVVSRFGCYHKTGESNGHCVFPLWTSKDGNEGSVGEDHSLYCAWFWYWSFSLHSLICQIHIISLRSINCLWNTPLYTLISTSPSFQLPFRKRLESPNWFMRLETFSRSLRRFLTNTLLTSVATMTVCWISHLTLLHRLGRSQSPPMISILEVIPHPQFRWIQSLISFRTQRNGSFRCGWISTSGFRLRGRSWKKRRE